MTTQALAAEATGRAASIADLLRELVPDSGDWSSARSVVDDGWFDAVTSLIVDAVLTADLGTLQVVIERLAPLPQLVGEIPDFAYGRLTALADVAHWAADRQMTEPAAAGIAPQSIAALVLQFVASQPGSTNQQVEHALALDKSSVSKNCTRLRNDGLVVARRLGKNMLWQVTPRGAAIAEWLTALGGPSPTMTEPVDDVRDVSEAVDEDVKEAVGTSSARLLEEVFQQLEKAATTGPRSPFAEDVSGSRVQMTLSPESQHSAQWCVKAIIAGQRTADPTAPRFVVDRVAVGSFLPKPGTSEMWLSGTFGNDVLAPLLGPIAPVIAIKRENTRWKVMKPGRTRAVSVHDTKKEAEKAGRVLAQKEGATVVVIDTRS